MTEQWAQPTPGQTVRVTTRFPEINYWATTKWKDTTYEGVVGRADRSVPQGSFMLLTPHTPEMPTRVIALGRVIKLEYADGSVAAKKTVADAVKVWQVSGSKGAVYTVTEERGQRRCAPTRERRASRRHRAAHRDGRGRHPPVHAQRRARPPRARAVEPRRHRPADARRRTVDRHARDGGPVRPDRVLGHRPRTRHRLGRGRHVLGRGGAGDLRVRPGRTRGGARRRTPRPRLPVALAPVGEERPALDVDLPGRAALHDLAVLEHHDLVGQGPHHAQIMADEEIGEAVALLQLAHQGNDREALFLVAVERGEGRHRALELTAGRSQPQAIGSFGQGQRVALSNFKMRQCLLRQHHAHRVANFP